MSDELQIPTAGLDRLCVVLTSEARVAVEHMTPAQHVACALEQLKLVGEQLDSREGGTRRDLALMHLFLSVRRDAARSTPTDDAPPVDPKTRPTFKCPICGMPTVAIDHESVDPAPHCVHRIQGNGDGTAVVTIILGNPNFAEARYGRGGMTVVKAVTLDP